MTTLPFSLEQDGLIVVEVCINLDYIFQMVLDTSCAHTVLPTTPQAGKPKFCFFKHYAYL